MQDTVRPGVLSELKTLYESDEGARNFFRWAANRQNDATQTSIEYLAQKAGVDRRQAIELAKELERLECGIFVVGRRGAKSRILWKASLKSIGRAAIGEAANLENVDPDLVAETADLKDEPMPGTSMPLTIAQAKKQLAASLGITPDAIEITIRA